MVSRDLKPCKTEAQQWSSGRRLTSAQRERKRAVDRVRASKRRTQVADHIASLELRLQELSSELARLEWRAGERPGGEAQDESSKLGDPVLPAQSSSADGVSSTNSTFVGDVSSNNNNNDHDVSSPLSAFTAPGWISAPPRHPGSNRLYTPSAVQGSMNAYISPMTYDPATTTERCTSITASHEAPLDERVISDCQTIFNTAVTTAHRLPSSAVCTDSRLNQDALIRGILFGWDSVITKSIPSFCCPLWEIIQVLDKRLFQLSGTITRLCTLRMLHSLLLCLTQANSFESLPAWYRPRPTQRRFPHAFAVDALPWPGLRERAVLNEKLTQTNKFWTRVIYDFRFCWPYSIPEMVCLSPTTGLYEFSGMYNNHLFEIRMWQMDMIFFESFPETYDDIIPLVEVERPLTIHHNNNNNNGNRTNNNSISNDRNNINNKWSSNRKRNNSASTNSRSATTNLNNNNNNALVSWHLPLPLPESFEGKVRHTTAHQHQHQLEQEQEQERVQLGQIEQLFPTSVGYMHDVPAAALPLQLPLPLPLQLSVTAPSTAQTAQTAQPGMVKFI